MMISQMQNITFKLPFLKKLQPPPITLVLSGWQFKNICISLSKTNKKIHYRYSNRFPYKLKEIKKEILWEFHLFLEYNIARQTPTCLT